MAHVHAVIAVEDFFLKTLQPASLADRRDFALRAMELFDRPDPRGFYDYAFAFPGNENGGKSEVILRTLAKYHAANPGIFRDYIQAIDVASTLLAGIAGLSGDERRLFDEVLRWGKNRAHVSAAMEIHPDMSRGAYKAVTAFHLPLGAKPVENIGGEITWGFAKMKVKNNLHAIPALKNRYYLRLVTSALTPPMAASEAVAHFVANGDSAEFHAANQLLSNAAMRWAANIIDPARRKSLQLKTIPLPARIPLPRKTLLKQALVSKASGLFNIIAGLGLLSGIIVASAPPQTQENVKMFLTRHIPGLRQ